MENPELAYLNRLVKIGIIDARFRDNFKPIINDKGLVFQSKDTEKYYILETPDGVFKEADSKTY